MRTPRALAGASGLRIAAIAVALGWSFVPIALLAYHTLAHGGVLTGSDGPLAGADQLFYMDSIRQSAQHLLITDHFGLSIGQPVFLNPLYLLGGLVWLIGVPIQAAFWSLNLVAAPALALGAVAVANRALPPGAGRIAAVAIALFYFSPVLPFLRWTGTGSAGTHYALLLPTGETTPAWQLWGYPHAGVTTGALAGALLGMVTLSARLRTAGIGDSSRLIAGIAFAGCLVGWLHPWQGATLIAVAIVLAIDGRSVRLALGLLGPVLATGAPMLYEYILSRTDAAWHVDSVQNAAVHDPLWMLLAALLPLAIPAAMGIRSIRPGPLRTMLIAWPVIGVVIYYATNQFPYHALQGISLPLSVLAVAAWQRHGRGRPLAHPLVAALAIAVITVPGIVYELQTFRDSERSGAAPYWLAPGEREALAYLDRSSASGGVLARQYIAMAVPAFTGRRTWVGDYTWTPQFTFRATLVEELMGGRLPAAAARRILEAVGARFVLTDCAKPAPIETWLGPLVLSKRTFGCAAVYELRQTANSSRSSAAWNRASVKRAAVSAPPARTASRSVASSASRRTTAAKPAASPGSNCRQLTPSSRYSAAPPPARLARTGRPTAIASSGTRPHGSCQMTGKATASAAA